MKFPVCMQKPSISQLRSPTKHVDSESSATLFCAAIHCCTGSSATLARPQPAIIIPFEPPMNVGRTPSLFQPQPNFGRPYTASRHRYGAPNSPLVNRSGISDVGGSWASWATTPSSTSELRRAMYSTLMPKNIYKCSVGLGCRC